MGYLVGGGGITLEMISDLVSVCSFTLGEEPRDFEGVVWGDLIRTKR